MTLVSALALWLHDLATVILIGHYLLLVIIYLPLSKSDFQAAEASLFLRKVMGRVQPWMGISLLIFFVTGVLLMFTNPNYLGVGNFGNHWSILMVAKHIVVIGMVVIASWITTLTREEIAAKIAAYNPHPPFTYQITTMIQLQSVLGVLVLLLTGLARIG